MRRHWRLLLLVAAALPFAVEEWDRRRGKGGPGYLPSWVRLSLVSALVVLSAAPAAAAAPVYLTFDDGPTRDTRAVLDALRRADVSATFFVVGKRAKLRPRLLRRMVREGHTVAIHGWRHVDHTLLSQDEQRRSIVRTRRLIRRVTGTVPLFFRPPYGVANEATFNASAQAGVSLTFWDVQADDWETQDPELIADRVVAGVRAGGRIVLLHDGPGDRAGTAAALPLIFDQLAGYAFRALP